MLTRAEPGDLLDIGSAAGFVSKGFQLNGWGVRGIEPSRSMAAYASREEGVPTTNDTLENFNPNRRFDLVLLVQVIAHIEDPAQALRKIRRILNPGGHVLIETWDSRSFTARLLGHRWHEYNPPSVLHAFSQRSLAELAEREGFKTIHSQRTMKTLRASHAKAILDHKLQNSLPYRMLLRPAISLVPGRTILPYPADDLFWPCLRLA